MIIFIITAALLPICITCCRNCSRSSRVFSWSTHNYTIVGPFAYFLRNMTGYSKYLSVKEAATAEKDQEQKEKSLNLYLIITWIVSRHGAIENDACSRTSLVKQVHRDAASLFFKFVQHATVCVCERECTLLCVSCGEGVAGQNWAEISLPSDEGS